MSQHDPAPPAEPMAFYSRPNAAANHGAGTPIAATPLGHQQQMTTRECTKPCRLDWSRVRPVWEEVGSLELDWVSAAVLVARFHQGQEYAHVSDKRGARVYVEWFMCVCVCVFQVY